MSVALPAVVPPANAQGSTGHSVPPAAIDCGQNVCYWSGEEWNHPSWFLVSSVETSIRVPFHRATTGDTYYVLLSVFDNTGSYDQIGFASDGNANGNWFPFWGYSNACPRVNSDYHDSTGSGPLAEGNLYTFKMTISQGVLSWAAFFLGARVFFQSVPTIATGLWISHFFVCGDGPKLDFTNYEEVHTLTGDQPVPNWSFFFQNTRYDGTLAVGFWISLKRDAPGQIVNYISDADLTIDNHFFMIGMNPPYVFSQQSLPTTFSWIGVVTKLYDPGNCFSVSCSVAITPLAYPTGWTLTVGPNPGVPTFGFTVSVTIPATTTPGVYEIRLRVDNFERGQWTMVRMTVTRLSTSFGGCVAGGTAISTPTGPALIQNLPLGAQVLGYDPSGFSFVTLNLLWRNYTTATTMIVLDEGMLKTTLRDQPIYIKNSSFTGWLQDPQGLGTDDLLYNPQSDTWIILYKINFETGTVGIYDVVTSGIGTFMANGLLLMRKT